MRTVAVLTCSTLMIFVAAGCASFPGEWLEEGTVQTDGTLKPAEGQRRAALQFMWPATVRYGAYDNLARVVDHQVVQSDTYFTMQWGKVAQFGALKARVKGDTLYAYYGGDVTLRFKRVKGDSIFPPMVVVPSLAKNQLKQPIDPLAAPVEPVYASSDGQERDME